MVAYILYTKVLGGWDLKLGSSMVTSWVYESNSIHFMMKMKHNKRPGKCERNVNDTWNGTVKRKGLICIRIW